MSISDVPQPVRPVLARLLDAYVLDLGANRFEGRGEELLSDPKVAELHVGGTARIDAPTA